MHKLIGMGVMNVTPDSFSDPGQLESLLALKQRLQEMHQSGITWFDVGAQSTAPGRETCGPEVEWQRLQNFIDISAQIPEGSLLSVDTYWPEVAWKFTQHYKQQRPDVKIIWNDVSGVIDAQTHRYLQQFKQAGLVMGLAPVSKDNSRQQVQTHWQQEDYFTADNIVSKAQDFFTEARQQLQAYGARCWFDPLFGFAKNAQTNWALWQGLPQIFLPNDQVVIGISRKRFLRQMIAESASLSDCDLWRASDYLQVLLLRQLLHTWQRPVPTLALRIHDPALLPALKSSITIEA
jgi:dihydropteroate synthase